MAIKDYIKKLDDVYLSALFDNDDEVEALSGAGAVELEFLRGIQFLQLAILSLRIVDKEKVNEAHS